MRTSFRVGDLGGDVLRQHAVVVEVEEVVALRGVSERVAGAEGEQRRAGGFERWKEKGS